MNVESVQCLYQSAETGVRASFGADQKRAVDYYAPLVKFCTRIAPPAPTPERTTLLDVGCGSGWSTFAFASAGYQAFGIDLNKKAFEAPSSATCDLQEGSALQIPYADNRFDVVVSYQCLEHVPAPRSALIEMARVCKPNGIVSVVGPNLVSPLYPLMFLCRPSTWRRMRYRRLPGMSRHPYGNTLWEILGAQVVRTVQLLGKLMRKSPSFTMREPDTVPPFSADNDACYLCNPVDLVKFFRDLGFTIERRGQFGRPPFSYLLAGGTWFAARKPAQR